MKAGRKLKPRALKILAGVPGKRQVPEEPAYPAGWPAMPKWLDAGGREEWEYVMAQMEKAGVVRLIDRSLLAAYCDAVSAAIAASEKARSDAQWLERANKTWTRARLFGALFGIGPAERGRVKAEDDGARSNGKARFFGA